MRYAQRYTSLILGLAALATTPRCNCDNGEGIVRASVQMKMTLVEQDPCAGSAVARDIPDDYTSLALSTDFGSRAERVFEIRSVGTAPLNISSISLSEADDEFELSIEDANGDPIAAPISISPSADVTVPPGVVLRVFYAAADGEPDLINLIVETDDPDRSRVEFGLAAGRGRIEVCGPNGCDAPAVDFGNVPRNGTDTAEVVIKNVGEGDLDLRDIKLESGSAEFCAPEATSVPEGTPNCNLVNLCKVLKPGEEYSVNIRYAPIDGGADMGVLRITSGDAAQAIIEVPINGVGAGPAICACVVDGAACNRVTALDFGSVEVGQTETRTVRLESCGTDPIELTEADLERDAGSFYETDAEFSIAAAFATGTYATGEFSEGQISYTPSAAGQNRGGLRYVISQGNLRSWLALTGRAATCDLETLPANVNFGTVAGGTAVDRTVVLLNNGANDCRVTRLTDPSDGAFTIPNKPALPLVIAPGASVDITTRYSAPARPTPAGDTATFEVESNEPAPDQVNTVTLNGQGGGTPICLLDIQPVGNLTIPITGRDGQLRFGAVNIGYEQTQSIRVTNLGNADCQLLNQNLTTQAPGEFRVQTSMTLPATIAPASSASIDVTFAPTQGASGLFPSYTSFRNHVDFVVSGPGVTKADWSIGLSARPTVPTIDIIPADVDFGVVTWDRPQAPDNRSSCGSEVRQVRIYNSGDGALDITGVSIDPTADPVFLITEVLDASGNSLSPPYAMTIPPGDNAEVRLRFYPSRVNPAQHNGLLVIENNVTMESTVPMRGEGTPNAQQTDVFDQLGDNKVDILWVIDDSGSMSEEQSALANNISWFTRYAGMLNADWQMAVTTTEINDAVSGKIWACTGFNKVIRHTDPDREAAFSCAANVTRPPNGNRRPNPTGSDEAEAGLQAARIALDVPVRDTDNAGFLRDDARLAVIVVSDEEDQSSGSVNLYIDFFRQIKGFRNPQLMSFNAIAGDVPGGCATAAAAQRYHDAARQLNGQFDSVCNSDWSTMLQNIGLDVFALRRSWSLSRPADPGTIAVRVDGQMVPQNSNNGWTYDAAGNAVDFNGGAIPQPSSRVEVSYNARCIP